ncbi:DUF3135 domain-containing protein [Nitrogeniibacter mangrovi]|uniref:DUF3135 domain-containing protein n=1 Tax=Nitrogeniibacter mangrovi TaxID=2016596 RepID=A0A6C1B3P1_9RHOO|nr:DUF3135 domain-containing protein [Nitrogeniibacter mangrovi]QID18266.1 DUF3135 domain-containing protein [Nitrogeniibacter mangrovi]
MSQFDFDAWANLARRSPRAYFHARERYLNSVIDGFPVEARARLREFQLEIDCLRANAGSPLGATRQMMVMMSDRLEAMASRFMALRTAARDLEALQAQLVKLDQLPPRDDEGERPHP